MKQKRIDRLLHALARTRDVYAIVTGDGALRGELEALATSLGIAQRVRFTGAREDTGNVFAALDVAVVTSDQEGMSSAMLEALACGVPVISTPVSGAREVLEDERRCGIVTSFEPDAVARAIERLRADSSLRVQLGRAAGAVALERYGVDGMIEQWERMLRPAAS